MDLSTNAFYKTPTREHFFRYEPAGSGRADSVTLVTLYPDAPAIERMPYSAGLFSVWGCVAATDEEFDRAVRLASEALRPVVAEPVQRSLTPVKQAS
jgi:hypothetical protein